MTYNIDKNRQPYQERGPKKDGSKAMIIGGLAMATLGLPLIIDGMPTTHFSDNFLPAAVQQYEFPIGAFLGLSGGVIGFEGVRRKMFSPIQ